MARPLLLRLLDNARQEGRDFKSALDEAPDFGYRWDVFGVRRILRATWWRLLREHIEPRELAIAVFLGVFIGLSPFYGTHVIAALSFAVLFRLNKLAIWLATNVSFPVISPFFAFISCQLGHLAIEGRPLYLGFSDFVERDPLDLVKELFLYWTVGFPIQGMILGPILAAVTYRVARNRQERSS
jgi:uncharacterized protein (DUF2062 family)